MFDSDGTLLKHFCGYVQQDLILHSTNNSVTVQLYSDNTINAAGFLASWQAVEEIEEPKSSDEGYVLSFPQTFTVGSDTSKEKLCLQMLNLKTDGEVSVDLYAKNEITTGIATTSKIIPVTAGDENIHCHEITLPESFSDKFAVVGIIGDIDGYKIRSYKSVRVLKTPPVGLLQTDKYDYRPKQEVNVRILLLNEELKPSKHEELAEIWIENPNQDRLFQEKNVVMKNGLAQVKYQLSEEPLLGKWLVKAKVGQNSSSELKATFEVNEAVLPTYEITVQSPKVILKDSTEETIKVCAKYTHGSNVKGQVNVTISTQYKVGTYWRAPIVNVAVSKVGTIDGCLEVTLNATELKDLTKKFSPIKVEAKVKEFGTGEKQSKKGDDIKVENIPFKLTAGTSPETHILNGFPFVAQVKAETHDSKAMPNINLKICARLYTSLSEMKDYLQRKSNQIYKFKEEDLYELALKLQEIKFTEICTDSTTDDQGMIKYAVNFENLDLPKNVTKLSIEFKAIDHPANKTTEMEQPSLSHGVTLTHTSAKAAIVIQPESNKLECSENKVTAFVTGPAGSVIELSSFIATGGSMVSSDTDEINMGETNQADEYIDDALQIKFVSLESRQDDSIPIILKKHELNIKRPFMSEISALDNVKLLVYVRDPETDETLYTSEDFEAIQCDTSKSKISFSENEVRPGGKINLKLSGPMDGFCGYSIVDKSVDLIPNPNKVTMDKIKRLKEALNALKIVNDQVRGEKCQDASLLFKAFEKLGLYVLSDKLKANTNCDAIYDTTNSTLNGKEEEGPEYFDSPVFLESVADFDYQPEAFGAAAAPPPRPQQSIARPLASAAPFSTSTTAFKNRIDAPGASSGSPPPVLEEIEAPTIDVRSFFPETWLFKLQDLDVSGQYEEELEAPHTVTTWVGEAFCTSAMKGVNIADKASFKVQQDFFVSMRTPYSIKRDELLPLNVTVFSKLSTRKLPLKIRVKESDQYKLGEMETNVCIDASDSQTKTFSLKMRELNEVNVTVEAVIEADNDCGPVEDAEGFADTIIKPIQVKPEGFPVETVRSEFLCRKPDEAETSLDLGNLEVPTDGDLVEGSARAWVGVTGDILAPTLNNLEKLVKMPYGCGEQNMISMVPNIYVVKYLEGTNQNKPDLINKAKKFMKAGYQRQEENYRHSDGSYSVWGPKDEEAEGSVWLTAFVVKAFSQASKYIDIDEKDLMKSQNWLNTKQNRSTGCFKREGFVVHSELATDSDVALTASLVIAKTEDKTVDRKDSKVVDNAFRCLNVNVNEESDLYTKALTAYAFALDEKEEEHGELSEKLLNNMIETANNGEPGKLFWQEDTTSSVVVSKDVEITAYNLLTLVKHERLPEALKVIKWLTTQRNANGGFKSTQDTMIAMQALAEYSLKISKEDNDLTVNIDAGKESKDFVITEDTELLLQMEKLENVNTKEAEAVTAKVNGGGCFMVQSLLRYDIQGINFLILIDKLLCFGLNIPCKVWFSQFFFILY